MVQGRYTPCPKGSVGSRKPETTGSLLKVVAAIQVAVLVLLLAVTNTLNENVVLTYYVPILYKTVGLSFIMGPTTYGSSGQANTPFSTFEQINALNQTKESTGSFQFPAVPLDIPVTCILLYL